MDVEGKVKNCSPRRKLAQFPARGEDKDFLARRGRKVILIKLGHIRVMLKYPAHRFKPVVERSLMAYSFVGPVGGKAALRCLVHSLRPYLNLDVGTVTILDRYVKRLVTIRLRM